MKKAAKKLEEDKTAEPVQVKQHPLDFLSDITRAYRGSNINHEKPGAAGASPGNRGLRKRKQ